MGTPYLAEIRMVSFNFPPKGWAFCNGQLLPINQNQALFSLLGTTYGGDGQTTFALPDLQSRIPIHQGNGFGLAQTGGAEQVTLTVGQLPAHSHPPLATSTGASTANPAGANFANWPDSPFAITAPATPMAPDTLGAQGGSQPHDNMPPYLGVNFIISLFGVFPSQT